VLGSVGDDTVVIGAEQSSLVFDGGDGRDIIDILGATAGVTVALSAGEIPLNGVGATVTLTGARPNPATPA
jgi:hypothetical protein